MATSIPHSIPQPLATLARIAHAAGGEIEKVRAGGIEVRHKADSSPVTQADTAAEALIERELAVAFAGVPVVGEELVAAGRAVDPGRRFFLVDPLDGTKEFIAGRDSYSTNIALVENGVPVAGVISAPARGEFFVGSREAGIWYGKLAVDAPFDAAAFVPWNVPAGRRKARCAAVSFSHMNEATEKWLAGHGITEAVRTGSAWKFSLLLTGAADVYPRLGNTWEWDTAAGHALLLAAGGDVRLPDGSESLSYGHVERNFLNPGFVAIAPGVELG